MSDATPEGEWVFADRYEVDAPIGRGGMGVVYSGYDRQLDRRVAIKLMNHTVVPYASGAEGNALAEDAGSDRERFLREIKTTAQLELPGIPAVYDFGMETSTGRIYLVMQLLFGHTLADLIAARDYSANPWPVSWAAAIGAQVAATLVDVHRVNVVHRDIKPSNLMACANGLVKILDFGVAILHGASALPKLTRIGMTVGSPPYMPPEQVLGNPVGPASDVYALGCVLYEMLTGRVPFLESSNRSYRDHHVNTQATPVRSLRPDVPADIDALILSMLAKRPSERPDAEAVYDALLPLTRTGQTDPADDRDPRRPFQRPLGPTPRARKAAPALALPVVGDPLGIDEAIDLHSRVAELVGEAHLRQAIDLLDNAVARSAHDPDLQLEMKIQLAATLVASDEYTRAAAVLDEILPKLDGHDDAPGLRFQAGISHAEIGEIDAAIGYLTEFLAGADPTDSMYRDALYQLGVMLPAVGRIKDGVAYLERLRPLLVAEYGPGSVHVISLDERIGRIRGQLG
jgi:serine/threonine protein kinase